MPGTLYVFKKRGETVDEDALLYWLNKELPVGVDYLEHVNLSEEQLKPVRES